MKIIKQIKTKLEEQDAIITKAVKGNTIVVIKKEFYQSKIHDFIQNNDFTILDKNYTNKYQEDIRNTINTCSTIIPKDKKWNLINLNLFPLTIRGLIKSIKQTHP